jgi:cytochrome c oxidase cbb3-type subunit III
MRVCASLAMPVCASLASCLALVACGAHKTAAPSPATASSPPAIVYEAHVAAGGIAPAGASLRNPHEGDATVAKNGALLFTAMNCDGCHGGDAVGWVGPSLADRRWRYGGADAEVFSSIYYGRPKGMPAFGGALGVEGVWSLVTYIRSLPPPSDAPTESWAQN